MIVGRMIILGKSVLCVSLLTRFKQLVFVIVLELQRFVTTVERSVTSLESVINMGLLVIYLI